MQNEDVKAGERPKGACLDASYCKKNFITMQNEDVKAEERPKGECLDASLLFFIEELCKSLYP